MRKLMWYVGHMVDSLCYLLTYTIRIYSNKLAMHLDINGHIYTSRSLLLDMRGISYKEICLVLTIFVKVALFVQREEQW